MSPTLQGSRLACLGGGWAPSNDPCISMQAAKFSLLFALVVRVTSCLPPSGVLYGSLDVKGVGGWSISVVFVSLRRTRRFAPLAGASSSQEILSTHLVPPEAPPMSFPSLVASINFLFSPFFLSSSSSSSSTPQSLFHGSDPNSLYVYIHDLLLLSSPLNHPSLHLHPPLSR